jgi:hypothetical protein
MSKWMRRSEVDRIENLARKAIRRGDTAEAARCYRALNLRQLAGQRHNDVVMRTTEFERRHADWQNKQIDLQAKLDELESLRRYATWHPRQIARAKAAEAGEAVDDV